MQAEGNKNEKNIMALLLMKKAKQYLNTIYKQKDGSKIVVKADKMINHSDKNKIDQADSINHDSLFITKKDLQKSHHENLYRSLQAKGGISQRQRSNYNQQSTPSQTKNQFKRHKHLQSIDQNELRAPKNKLYQIPIPSYRLRERCDKNGISFIKFSSQHNGQPPAFSQNFNTYFEFKQFMSKLSNEGGFLNKRSLSKQQNLNIVDKNVKKCSIIPALKPTYRPKNSHSSSKSNPFYVQSDQYLQTRKTKIFLQKSLVVESKKQQLVTHIISRYKNKIKSKQEQNQLKLDQMSQLEDAIKIQQLKRQDPQKNAQFNKTKQQQRNSPFVFNGHEEGVYEQKIRSYRQLLFLVNLAHRVFDPLIILDSTIIKLEKTNITRPTYYIGPGNNGMLVRSLMRRRIWWDEVTNYQNANFVWTQLKITSIYANQKNQEPLIQQQRSQNLPTNIELLEQQQNLVLQKAINIKKQKQQAINLDKIANIQKNSLMNLQNKKDSNSTTYPNIPKGLMFRAPFAYFSEQKIITEKDYKHYKKMMEKLMKGDFDNFESRIKYYPKNYFRYKEELTLLQVHNHFQFNHSLGNKKALFYHMQLFYKLVGIPIDKAFPKTFHIRNGENDLEFKNFLKQYQRISKDQKDLKNIWILKPGQNSNRGNGIAVIKQISQIKKQIKNRQKHKNGQIKTFILQKYIQKPLLYNGRKFDIRHYMIISGMHGKLRGYWYGEGYIRTSSYIFNLQQTSDPMIHLTNDAIQKQCEDYGVFQQGNKISYNQLQKYFNKQFPEKKFDFTIIFAKMRQLAKEAIFSTYVSLDPNKKLHNFQIFGLDFMIEDNLNVVLIQVNTNPCLELSSGLLSRIIPNMLEQSFRITLDALFPPPVHYSNNTRHLAPDCSLDKLQLQLIFDEERDGKWIADIYEENKSQYKQMMNILQGSQKQLDQVFDNEGQQIEIEKLIP